MWPGAESRTAAARGALGAGAGILVVLGAWSVGAAIAGNAIVLPTPSEVAAVFFSEILSSGSFVLLAGTALRVLVAFASGAALGLALGSAAVWLPLGAAMVSPVLVVLQAVPAVAVILLALIWFPTSIAPVVVAMLLVVPILASGVRAGHAARDPLLLEAAATYRLTPWQCFREITLPAAMPALSSAMRVALGLSWKAVIAAEVIIEPARAIGTEMQLARLNLDTPRVFAWILLAVLASGLTDLVWVALTKLILARESREFGPDVLPNESTRAV